MKVQANDPTSRSAAVAAAAERSFTPELADVLNEIHLPLPFSPRRAENLQALQERGTVAVLTGQQPGIFLSPLLALYKALQAAAAARRLEAETGVRAVPVFWVAAEDHDFEEIRQARILNREAEIRELALSPREKNRIPVGELELGPEIEDVLSKAAEWLGFYPGAGEVLEICRASYKPELSPARAFISFLGRLTADCGLLFYNPRERGAAGASGEVFRTALLRAGEIEELLLDHAALEANEGRPPQVRIKRGSPLFFFQPEGKRGPRYRLKKEGRNFTIEGAGGAWSEEQLLRVLDKEPERFSTSALLRPLLQDSLFPTACYIGGPAELAYLRQIEPLYPVFGLPRPLLIPRTQCSAADEKFREWLALYSLSIGDLNLPVPELLVRALEQASPGRDPKTLEARVLADIGTALSPLAAALEQTDRTLLGSLGRTEEKIKAMLDTLTERYTKALAAQDSVVAQRVEKLRTYFKPNHEPQERFFSSLYFLCRYGLAFVEKAAQAIEPFGGDEKVIQL